MGAVVRADSDVGHEDGPWPANDLAAGASRHLQAHGHLAAFPVLLRPSPARLPPVPGLRGDSAPPNAPPLSLLQTSCRSHAVPSQ